MRPRDAKHLSEVGRDRTGEDVSEVANDRAPGPGSDDRALLRLVAEGDPRASRMLAMRVVQPVRRIAHAMIRNPHDAEDAAQQALVTILDGVTGFRGESSLERWARGVAVRVILRHAQQRRRRDRSVERHDPDALAAMRESATPSEALPKPVHAYLDRLPPKQRQALVLRHVLGYRLEEISSMEKIPVSTVKYRIQTAMARVRREIRRDVAFGGGVS